MIIIFLFDCLLSILLIDHTLDSKAYSYFLLFSAPNTCVVTDERRQHLASASKAEKTH
jgi:hypothetical protein